jgi:hypothetical protein
MTRHHPSPTRLAAPVVRFFFESAQCGSHVQALWTSVSGLFIDAVCDRALGGGCLTTSLALLAIGLLPTDGGVCSPPGRGRR